MTSYLNNGYDIMNYFAKFETFLPHSIIIPSFMTIGSQMPELDWGRGLFPPYKIGSQNTPYKLGLIERPFIYKVTGVLWDLWESSQKYLSIGGWIRNNNFES